ncbi:hypothetical protein H5T51_00080 [Candidatus Bathyarchaeota archaeon]|nr:hypothetical protein [Candidatus Bathyarchaeota archaeon]
MMVRRASSKKEIIYTVDLMRLDGDGSFPCPRCGVIISPDDETDEVYQIIDTKVEGDQLSELTLKCNGCGSLIRLVGFLVEIVE